MVAWGRAEGDGGTAAQAYDDPMPSDDASSPPSAPSRPPSPDLGVRRRRIGDQGAATVYGGSSGLRSGGAGSAASVNVLLTEALVQRWI